MVCFFLVPLSGNYLLFLALVAPSRGKLIEMKDGLNSYFYSKLLNKYGGNRAIWFQVGKKKPPEDGFWLADWRG
jgi:hypothetical protein